MVIQHGHGEAQINISAISEASCLIALPKKSLKPSCRRWNGMT
ncbi:MAG: hypothetical protein ACK5HK_04380 [Pseudanabaena sp.]